MTSGAGTFARTFVRYDAMPSHLAEAARKDHAPSR
jgi:elongation factor G